MNYFVKTLVIVTAIANTAWAMEDTKKERVVIVGAGMAGLTAAHELQKSGFKPVIFEGRDRIGGRTNTHYFDKDQTVFFEEGGTTIDHDHYTVQSLAKELGVELIKKGHGTRDLVAVFKNLKINVKDELISALEEIVRFLEPAVEKLEKDDLDSAIFFKEKPAELSDLAWNFLKTDYEQEYGVDLDSDPQAHIGIYHTIQGYLEMIKTKYHSEMDSEDIDEDFFSYNVKGGMSRLVNKLAEVIEPSSTINLNHNLLRLRKDAHYTLTFDCGGKEVDVIADYVIMTIPFSTLRWVKIDNSVGLSDLQKLAIATLPYGNHSKVGIPMVGETNIYNQLSYYFDLDSGDLAWPGEQALTLYINGKKAVELNDSKGKELAKKHVDFLGKEYPGKTIGEAVVKNWSVDQFSNGSYSAVTRATNPMLLQMSEKYPVLKTYAEPVDGLFFAGEHTVENYGFIEAAVLSGIQAAKNLKDKINF